MFDYFTVLAAYPDPDFGSSQIILSIPAGQDHMNFTRPGLLLYSGIQTNDTRIHSIRDAAVKAQQFFAITKYFVPF